jgi:hypothetical protein
MTEQEQQEKKAPRRVELTERDLYALRWIGEQYAVAFNQLQRILGSQAGAGVQTPGILSESAARVWLTRMKALDVIESAKPFRALPTFVWLRPAGLRLAGLDFKHLKPALTTLNHLYWCNQARLYMAAKRPTDVWVSERQLRSEQAAQAAKNQRRRPELPDAHLVTQKGKIAIEIELTDKQAARLLGLVRRRAIEYYTVWYFCTLQTKGRVEAAKKELAADVRERVQIYDIQQLEEESEQ